MRTQPVSSTGRPTFSTVCPFCSVRYQYDAEVINKTLHCQNCKKDFTGCEVNGPSGTAEISSSHPRFSHEKEAVSQDHSADSRQSTFTSQKDLHPEMFRGDPCLGRTFPYEVNKDPMQNIKCQDRNLKNGSDRKKQSVSEATSVNHETPNCTENGEDTIDGQDGDNQLGQNSEYHTARNLRRSVRTKQQVPYDENMHDDNEFMRPSKRPKSFESVELGMEHVKMDGFQSQASLAANMGEKDKEASPSEDSLQNTKPESEQDSRKVSLSGDLNASPPEFFEYPDSDFNNFDELRQVESFSKGQLWAVYDNLDGMPRFYALIKKVWSTRFKVRITWLEPDPDDEEKIKWVTVGLPASCGTFKLGNTEVTEDHGMFSHLANWEKLNRRDIYRIYPRKGEIWAVFKDWDLNWASILGDKKDYEFEFVEVLTEYADDGGVQVAYLAKLKGFVSLFRRPMKEGRGIDVIPAEHIFKFSHKVPFFQMSGEEGKNVPAGSFELDPAALHVNHNGIETFENLDLDKGEMELNGSSSASAADTLEAKHEVKQDGSPTQFVELKSKPAGNASVPFGQLEAKLRDGSCFADNRSKGSASLADSPEVKAEYLQDEDLMEATEAVKVTDETSSKKLDLKFKVEGDSLQGAAESFTRDIASSQESNSGDCAVPPSDFYSFKAEISLDKFQVGQVWALYSDEDTLPKYYCIIIKIDSPPNFGLHVKWLIASSRMPKDIIQWVDKDMPISCGHFKPARRKNMKYHNTSVFSHEIKLQPTVEKHVYIILPQAGDVWALYKAWNKNFGCSDLKNCEYEIVEVLKKHETGIIVLVLERAKGFKSVFGPQMQGNPNVTKLIPWAELLRFSHQVPALRLSEEKEGGNLMGCWETDPAALPDYFFSN